MPSVRLLRVRQEGARSQGRAALAVPRLRAHVRAGHARPARQIQARRRDLARVLALHGRLRAIARMRGKVRDVARDGVVHAAPDVRGDGVQARRLQGREGHVVPGRRHVP